ncbi:hypothetical protein EUTSA_v10001588mg [Eutrema salsugineum]|uniref:Fold protein n=1 Tax=Eutrema salsugineum TaxID=72664 RepID=V4LHR8_EUTSA|nr:uncharacterized protein LOC18015536 [Eutrema salsugineum]ESQ39338.1 hypothetical protein EUTSA_v10001588mg [Eutrema salsugineum]
MASEESWMINSSSILDEDYDDTDDGFHYQTRQSSLSRLSICTSSFHEDDEDNCTNHPTELGKLISELSLESFDDVGAEADGEISDDGEDSDSDKESPGFYYLPTIMSRRRRKVTVLTGLEKEKTDGSKCDLVKQRRVVREKSKRGNHYRHGFNGVERDSDGDGNRYVGGRELTVLTKVKGGKKSMKMGLEEVKACRDLGFDLEVPGRVPVSAGSNRETQTSSGGNSPIANWRISSPGDDPKEVKARLKMWAQAVALASASR